MRQDLTRYSSKICCDLACKNVQDHGRKILHDLSDKILEFTMNKIYQARSGWYIGSYKICSDLVYKILKSLLRSCRMSTFVYGYSNDSSCDIVS